MSFSTVYCAIAPSPEKVQRLTQAMFNRNAIYVAKLEYPERLLVAVAISTIPAGRTAEEDVAKLLAMNRENQNVVRANGLVYEVSEVTTSFGPGVSLRINNVESDTAESGPFPLARKLVAPANGALLSMSVHRLFARGPDRFEVAAMQLAPQPASKSTEEEMYRRLTEITDALAKSLQQCTATLPVRVPK